MAVVAVIFVALTALNFIAVARIILKAGYSQWWSMLPLSVFCLMNVELMYSTFVLRHAITNGFNFSTPLNSGWMHSLLWLIAIDLLLNWAFFLVFAFSTWPISVARPESRTVESDWRARPVPMTPVAAGALAQANGTTSPDQDAGGTAVATIERQMPKTLSEVGESDRSVRATIFCSWCGHERSVDAHEIHYCGSPDRPPVYCMSCGTALVVDASQCDACGTSTTEVSARRRHS
jgi:hypothetical protein